MKESRFHIEQQDVIWYQPLLDEQTVRRQGGVPEYVDFTQGIAHFTTDYHPNYGIINYGEHFSPPMDLMGDITIEMYIRPDNYGLGCGSMCKILRNGEFAIGLATDNGPWGGNEKCVWATSNETTYPDSGDDSIVLNEWVNIILTRTVAGIMNFYLDGVLTGTANQDGGAPDAPNDDLVIVDDFHFIGDIDYVMIYNRILTVSEIENLNDV